jgi:hypothetical protein
MMGELSDWLSHLDQRQFDVFKILLEKGLLAAIVGIAGAIFAILMERYKSALKKQEELSKIVIPQINEVLAKSEALYQQGQNTLVRLAEQYKSLIAWVDALYRSPTQIDISPISHAKGPEDLQCPLEHQQKGQISIAQLLEDTAPDELVKSVLRRPDFLSGKERYNSSVGFLYVLYEMLKLNPSNRDDDDRRNLLTSICHSVFVPMITAPRRDYRSHVQTFVLATMRQLPLDNRKQKRAYGAIMNMLPIMTEVVDEFPKRDIIKITSEEIATSEGLIADSHARLVAQLRVILQAV